MPVIHEKKQSKPSTVRKSHQRAIEEAYSTTFYHVQPHHSEEFSTDAQSIRDQFTVRTPADCPLNTAAAFLAPRKLAVGILKENSHTRKKPAGHINRPPNAFILFRSAQSANMTSATTSNNGQQQRMSSLIAAYWRSLSKAERATWFSLADDVKNFHNLLFPEYRFIPHPNTVEAEERTRKTNMHAHSTATPEEDAYIDQEMVKFILRHNGGVTVDLEALAVQERLLASESSTSKKPRSKRAPKQVKADAPSPIIQMPQVPDMFPSYPTAVSDYGSPSSSAFSPVLMSPVLEPYSAVGSPYPDFSGKQEDIGSPLIQFDPNYSMQQCYSPVTYTDSPVSAPSSTLVTPQSGITHTVHHQASIQFGDDVYNSYSLHTNSNVGPMDGFLNMAPGSSDWNGQQVEVSPGGVAFINSFAVAEPQPQAFSNPMYYQPEVQPQKANQALQLQHQYYMPAESQQEPTGAVHSPWVVEDGWFPPSSTSTAVHTPTTFA